MVLRDPASVNIRKIRDYIAMNGETMDKDLLRDAEEIIEKAEKSQAEGDFRVAKAMTDMVLERLKKAETSA
ncbi:hypothetical protein GCM10010275_69260 [Streptomyces litmocidini]|uniref:hypothetical protein n=1 Tax=Streptomyces litmocidini TaxID=67318 RepID=UPI00167D8739|nr:hypothetical protein [Streptomyces litmocidini]GGV17767.1 hypothetical protein GCM10010275_69260 [Streptomyces litmocidini]